MAVFIAKTGIRVALLQIDEPAFDAVRHDVLFWNSVAGTVELADIAVHTKILDAEFAWLIFDKRQIGGDKARAKARAIFLVNQAAVSPQFTKTDLIKDRYGLDL